jgi:AP-3 complex subunit mu
MIDAIVFLDSGGNLITSRVFKHEADGSNTPSASIPGKLLHMIASRSNYQPIHPIHVDAETGDRFLTLVRDGLFLIGKTRASENFDPLMTLSVLETVYTVMRKYYGTPLTDSVVKSNFNTVYPLLDEMLEGGYPFSMELNTLESTAVPPSMSGLVDKLASVVNSGSVTNSLTGVSPEVWWRRGGVFHASNEFYVDVIDRINCVISPTGKMISGSVSGSIRANCRMSGQPDLLLSFKNAKLFDSYNIAFHPCVRHARWQRDQKLSFTPPDGDFVLAEYVVNDKSKVQLPFTLSPKLSFEPESGRISVSVIPRLNVLDPSLSAPAARPGPPGADKAIPSRIIEDLIVKIKLPRMIVSATLITQTGTAIFDPPSGLLVWSAGSLRPESAAGIKLEGTLQYSGSGSSEAAKAKEIRCAATAEFSVKGWQASGVVVDTVDVHGVDYTPYKGCRYTTRGGTIDLRI